MYLEVGGAEEQAAPAEQLLAVRALPRQQGMGQGCDVARVSRMMPTPPPTHQTHSDARHGSMPPRLKRTTGARGPYDRTCLHHAGFDVPLHRRLPATLLARLHAWKRSQGHLFRFAAGIAPRPELLEVTMIMAFEGLLTHRADPAFQYPMSPGRAPLKAWAVMPIAIASQPVLSTRYVSDHYYLPLVGWCE